jgi:opacity protein-like surface antigen
MKNVISTKKTLFLAAAVSLGLSASAFAGQDPGTATPSAPATSAVNDRSGQLGQSYVKLGYSYMDVRDSDVNANAFNFAINQNVREGVDTLLEYDYLRTENLGGLGHATEHDLRLGARGFVPLSGGIAKPYGEAGIGWAWTKVPTIGRDNSFTWFAGAGVELEAMSNLSFTPFVRYNYAVDFSPKHTLDYGVKGNYWFSERAGLELKVTRDNSRDMTYGAGFNIRY